MYMPNYRVNYRGIPIIKNSFIDYHAEKMIYDYCPDIYKNPRPIDVEDLVFSYMGLKQDFNYLSNSGFIWGRMVFRDTAKIPIYIPETNEADYMPAKRGTIIIDNSIVEDRKDFRYRSTVVHECGHWVYHQQLFMNSSESKVKNATLCRAYDIDSNLKVLKTDLDWIEHQAKYFSGALLMPKSVVVKICSNLEEKIDLSEDFCKFKVTYMAKRIAQTFNVSQESAKVRIQQLGLVMSKQKVSTKQYI